MATVDETQTKIKARVEEVVSSLTPERKDVIKNNRDKYFKAFSEQGSAFFERRIEKDRAALKSLNWRLKISSSEFKSSLMLRRAGLAI